MLLSNGGCLKHVVLKLLLGLAGIHDQESDQKHTLILGLQLLQKGLCILTVGGQVGRDNVHVITGTDCLFLLLNLAAVKLGNGVLDLLDGSGLVYRLDVHGDDLAGLHIQKILQKLVGKIRCCDLQITHGSVQAAHGKGLSAREGKGCGSNEVLHGKSGACQPAPVEVKTVSIAHVKHGMHQLQTFLPIEHPRGYAKALEVIHQVGLYMLQAGLCLAHGLGFNAEGDIFGLCQTVIALSELHLQHLTVLAADIVEVVVAVRNADVLLKNFGIRRHIHERQLEVDGAVEKIQEGAPLFKDRGLVLLLSQLIVDVLILDGLGVILVADAADAIREHTLERDRLLRGTGNAVITPCAVDDLLNLPCLSLSQILRHVQVSFFCFSEQIFHRKQCDLPPFLPVPDGSGRHSSCSSDRDGPSALQTWPE